MDDTTFFAEISRRLRCDDTRAESVTFAVFQELLARLTPQEAFDVAAQLPPPLKRLWRAEDRPHVPFERIHAEEFVGRVRSRLSIFDDREAERAVLAVFGTLQHALGSTDGTEGEAGDILAQLPKDLKALWRSANIRGGE